MEVDFEAPGHRRVRVERRREVPAPLNANNVEPAVFLFYAAKALHALGSASAARDVHTLLTLNALSLQRGIFELFKSFVQHRGRCVGELHLHRSGGLSMATHFHVPLRDVNDYVADSVLLVLTYVVEAQRTDRERRLFAQSVIALEDYYASFGSTSLRALREAPATAFERYQLGDQ